jgi:hypothetical protein
MYGLCDDPFFQNGDNIPDAALGKADMRWSITIASHMPHGAEADTDHLGGFRLTDHYPFDFWLCTHAPLWNFLPPMTGR